MLSSTGAQCVYSAGRLARIMQSACLAAWPSGRTVAPAASPRLSIPACIQHAATSTPLRCAARKAGNTSDDGMPQQRSKGEGPPKPTAPRRTRSSHTPVRGVPWNAATEAAVQQFWTEQGALLPEANVQPEQQAEQRRLRSKIARWAANHPRHRDLVFLTDYMARTHDAAAGSGWADDPWRIVLVRQDIVADNMSPSIILQHAQAAQRALAEHGVSLSHAQSLMLWGCKGVAARAGELLLALERLPISLDFATIIKRVPNILALRDIGDVLERRMAAMQQLHPQLDVARVLSKAPSLLLLTEETLAANWTSLQTASGLGNDGLRELVQHYPHVLFKHPGVIGWKLKQIDAYESARKLAGGSCSPVSSWGRVLSAAAYRVWRLRHLTVVSDFRYVAQSWVRMEEKKFAALNLGYSLWLASHPVPPGAYWDRHSR